MNTILILPPFGNWQADVPKGQLKIAQRFNAGATNAPGQVPKGRLKEGAGVYVQNRCVKYPGQSR